MHFLVKKRLSFLTFGDYGLSPIVHKKARVGLDITGGFSALLATRG